eukprot:g44825.t1
MFLGYERNTGYYRVYDPVGEERGNQFIGETPEKKDNLFSVGWSAEPNPESNTDSLTPTISTEPGPPPDSNDPINEPPALGPSTSVGGVVHEITTPSSSNVVPFPLYFQNARVLKD